MGKNAKNASVLQILVVTYLVITIPAILFAYYTVKSIDDELALHVEFVESGEPNLNLDDATILISFGALLRKHSTPFSEANDDHSHNQIGQLSSWTEHLRNARAAIIYCWLFLLFFGAFVYLALATNLQRIFTRLANAIDNLRQYNLTKKIRIDGPFDMTGLSTSLENLRLTMSSNEEQQQRFLQHISHEIKTPLASIKEGSKLLDEQMLGEMNNEQQEITNILVRSSVELQRAIENLLDYNATVALKQATKLKRLDLAKLARQALSNNELSIKQKELLVDAQLDECRGDFDQGQILTVFDNLISNAIKHSPTKGTIGIKLSNNGTDEISFLVTDQGPGVSKRDERFIFDPFYVGAQRTETTLKGTGLGLSIAKQYVRDHSGELALIKNRKGAAFKVVLPVK